MDRSVSFVKCPVQKFASLQQPAVNHLHGKIPCMWYMPQSAAMENHFSTAAALHCIKQ